MDLKPKVSVIIPNYNHLKFLQQRLDTVFNQTFQDFEVILLDDASSDGSQDFLKTLRNHPKVSHVVLNIKNSGSPFKQWQKGLSLAKGEYVWIAESDDYCELTFLEQINKGLLQDVQVCYSQTFDTDEFGGSLKNRISYTQEFEPNIWKHSFVINGNIFIKDYLLEKNVIPNASAVVFKRAILKNDFLDETLTDMSMCGDWLFWVRLCFGNKVAFVSDPLNYFRSHNAVSRIHDSLQKKRERLKEESIIRSEAYNKKGFRNQSKEMSLYYNWFSLHRFMAILTKSFYEIKMPQTSMGILLFTFIKFKLKRKSKF